MLGHVQRGGTPTPYDRVLATRFGVHATDAAHRGEFGTMVALHGRSSTWCPWPTRPAQLKTVPKERYDEAAAFFG